MAFRSWILAGFVSRTLLAHSKETQSVFRRFKTYHSRARSKAGVCPRTQKSIPKGQLCAEGTYHWNRSVTPYGWGFVSQRLGFQPGFYFRDFMSKLDNFIWQGLRVEMARDDGMLLYQAQSAFWGRTLLWWHDNQPWIRLDWLLDRGSSGRLGQEAEASSRHCHEPVVSAWFELTERQIREALEQMGRLGEGRRAGNRAWEGRRWSLENEEAGPAPATVS